MANKQNKFPVGNWKMILGIGITFVVLIALGAAYVINSAKHKNDGEAQVHLNDTNLWNGAQVDSQTGVALQGQNDRVKATVDIAMNDAAIPVGSVFKVVAIVTPSDTERSLVWTSSDSKVFTVSADGIVNVNGKGTAVLTATVGTATDAVIIEGIESVADGSANGLKVYTVAEVVAANNTSGTANNGNEQTGGNTGASNGGTGSTGNANGGSGSAGNGSTGNSSGGSASGGNASNSGNPSGGNSSGNGNTSNTGGGNTGGNAGGNANGNTGNSSSGGSSNNTGGGTKSDSVGAELPGMGFQQVMSNVYTYQENGAYCGEIITQQNATICYIKTRTSGFDSTIQGVLSSLLGDGAGQVWNSYVVANTDRTFQVNGRMARIVVDSGGGHSQIVIYN